jgi:tetratricopeptide (TPR) repeat protein
LQTLQQASGDDLPWLSASDVPWLLNNRAIALRRLGRFDEALVDLQRASAIAEDGGANVSQKLNLGLYLAALGRPDEALAALGGLGPASAYGSMVESHVRLRAGQALGDGAMVEQALSLLRAQRSESGISLVRALARAGRDDEAAEVLMELLADPDERADVLSELQDYRIGPALPGFTSWDELRRALLSRPDVAAAVRAVGRVETLPVFGAADMD